MQKGANQQMKACELINIETVIAEYVDLQMQLIESLKQQYGPVANWDKREAIQNIGSGDTLMLEECLWTLKPHGLGCRFLRPKDGVIVDVLERLGSAPESFDPSRLETYLESQNVLKFSFEADEYEVCYQNIYDIFLQLLSKEQVCRVDKYNIFVLTCKT
tara:strand:+ start:1232 stop:1711 length:480 start_codon:yes stop_codon:yes gene_type:complete